VVAKNDSDKKKKIKLTPAEALPKIQKYCAYQERSHKEVRNKLFEYNLWPTEVEEVISQLITDNFLNEERFAKAYAGGKFRIKKWGKLKIVNELNRLGLTERCINRGLKEIDSSDYSKTLRTLLKKKANEVKETNSFIRRNKIAKFAIGKGYESDVVWEYVKDIIPD
jgi:regulatory protein